LASLDGLSGMEAGERTLSGYFGPFLFCGLSLADEQILPIAPAKPAVDCVSGRAVPPGRPRPAFQRAEHNRCYRKTTGKRFRRSSPSLESQQVSREVWLFLIQTTDSIRDGARLRPGLRRGRPIAVEKDESGLKFGRAAALSRGPPVERSAGL